jgi:predicted DNA-binding WGR domain protein
VSAAHSTARLRLLARIILPVDQLITVLNQSRPTDSNLSLDVESALRDPAAMVAQPYQLYVERTDATKNMARYYAMSIEPTLFGEACLIRRWGRIGAGGQRKVHHFTREEDAVALFLELLRRKRSRGYRPKLRCRQESIA